MVWLYDSCLVCVFSFLLRFFCMSKLYAGKMVFVSSAVCQVSCQTLIQSPVCYLDVMCPCRWLVMSSETCGRRCRR